MQTAERTTKYQVIDRQTGTVISEHSDVRRARAKRDRLDGAYGAVRYAVREVAA